jgi:hypothetical protein
VVREGVGQVGEMTQALYVHMNNKRRKKENSLCHPLHFFPVSHLNLIIHLLNPINIFNMSKLKKSPVKMKELM